jgi:hypothetical protein
MTSLFQCVKRVLAFLYSNAYLYKCTNIMPILVTAHFLEIAYPMRRTTSSIRITIQQLPQIVILLKAISTRERNKKCFWGVVRGRRVRLTTPPPSVSLLSKPCVILNISQPYRPSQTVMVIDLLIYIYMMSVPHRKHNVAFYCR